MFRANNSNAFMQIVASRCLAFFHSLVDCLETSDSTSWNGCVLLTVWASQGELSLLVSKNQLVQAWLAVAPEQLWVSVGAMTNGAFELIF